MNPQQMQGTGQLLGAQPTPPGTQDPNVVSLTPDPTAGANQAKAGLGLVTTMQEHLLKHKQAKKESMKPQQPKGDTASQNIPQPDEKITKLQDEMDSFKKEVKSMIKDEIGSLKQDIQDALKEDGSNE